jgi:acyl-coenzyme A thioesterase PaaI-like protein
MSTTTKLSLPLHGATSPEAAHPTGICHDGLAAILDNSCVQVAVPSTSSSTGQVGQFAVDATHLYVCIAANTWCRVTIATW